MLLVFLIILLPLVISHILIILQWGDKEFKYAIYLSSGGMVLGWVILLFVRPQLPIRFALPSLGKEVFFPNPPAFLIDQIAWVFAISLFSFGTAVILIDSKHVRRLPAWVMGLLVVGLLTIFSANPFTLSYSWVFFDVLILLCVIFEGSEDMSWTRIVNAFAMRFLGIFLVVVASLLAYRQGLILEFDSIFPFVAPYLIVAGSLRLGIWLPSSVFKDDSKFEFLLRMFSSVTSLLLIVRTANVNVFPAFQPIFLIVFMSTSLIAGIRWAFSNHQRGILQGWIVGMSSLAIVFAILGYPRTSFVWGFTTFLMGSFPFLAYSGSIPYLVFGLLSFLGLVALPFMPLWFGAGVVVSMGWGLFIGINHGLLAGGYLKLISKKYKIRSELSFGELLPSFMGLVFLLITQVVALSLVSGYIWDLSSRMTNWWMNIISIAVILGVIAWDRFSLSVPEFVSKGFSVFHTIPRFLNHLLKILYTFFNRLLTVMTDVFEGEGGLIWSLLGAFLLITLLASLRGG